jgi:putative FmdB family regulatory protein
MPSYEHHCETHGNFTDLRSFDRSSEPADCPVCGAICERAVSAPRLAILDKNTRVARERNERSAHEPRVHVCHSGCNHAHQNPTRKGQGKNPGLTAYTGPRPWVVEHA